MTILRAIVDTLCKMSYSDAWFTLTKYVYSALLKIINLNLNDLVVQDLRNPSPRLSPLIQFQQSTQLAILTFVYGPCFRAADTQAQGPLLSVPLPLPSSAISCRFSKQLCSFDAIVMSRVSLRCFICLLCSRTHTLICFCVPHYAYVLFISLSFALAVLTSTSNKRQEP